MKLKTLFTGVLLLSFLLTRAQTADEVINKYLDAIGGAANWKKVTSLTATGKMSMMGMDLPLSLHSKPVNKQKITISVQGNDIVQAYDGKVAWMINPMAGSKEPQQMPPDQAKEFADQEFEDEFIDYKKKGSTVKYAGTEVVDGIKCHKIEMNRKGTNYTYYFDADNHIQIMMKNTPTSGPMSGQDVNKYVSDYQEISGGLMIPFSTDIKVGGQTLQKLTFEKVTVNDPIDDSVFAFPKK